MTEQFNNFNVYSLAGSGCAAVDTSLVLESLGSLAQVGTYRLMVGGAEIVCVNGVTPVNSSVQVTRGTEGTTAVAWPGGTPVVPIVTSAAIRQMAFDLGYFGNPLLLATDWYLDGTNGDDSNTGLDSAHPVKTIMGGLVPKWGTSRPRFAQDTTIHVIGSQTIGLERIVLDPIILGSRLLHIDGLGGTEFSATFSAGSVTPFAWGNPGVKLQVAGMPGGTVAGQILFNQTRQSYAEIESVAGGVATLSTPYKASLFTPVHAFPAQGQFDFDWQSGDTLQVGTMPYLNLLSIEATGGDSTGSGSEYTAPRLWARFLRIPEVGAATGNSGCRISSNNVAVVVAMPTFDSEPVFDSGDSQFAMVILGCNCLGGAYYRGDSTYVQGGSSNASGNQFTYLDGVSDVEDGFTAYGQVYFSGTMNIGAMQVVSLPSTAVVALSGSTLVLHRESGSSAMGTGSLWGIGNLYMNQGARAVMSLTHSVDWANLINLPIFFGNGSATASCFVSATGDWCTNIPLTIANLTAWGSLLDGASGVQTTTSAGFIGMGSPSVPPSWLQTAWYISNAGSDQNSGADSSHPVQTYNGGVVAKWGTPRARLAGSVAIHIIDSQAAGIENVDVDVQLVGTLGTLTFVGTPANIGAQFSPVSVVAESHGNPGSDWSMTVPAGAPTTNAASGVLVQNVTRSSYAWIISAANSVLRLARPHTDTDTGNPDLNWQSTDVYQYLSVPTFNLVTATPRGGIGNAPNTTLTLFRFLKVPDPSPNGGLSACSLSSVGHFIVADHVWFDPFLSAQAPPGWAATIWNCYVPNGAGLEGSGAAGSLTFASNVQAIGGYFASHGTGFSLSVKDASLVGSVVDADVEWYGSGQVAGHFTNGVHQRTGNASLYYHVATDDGGMWGAGTLGLNFDAKVSNSTGQNWANVLALSSLNIDGQTTGFARAQNGVTYGPFTISSSNLDTYGSLGNPETGAMFSGGPFPAIPVTWQVFTAGTYSVTPGVTELAICDTTSGSIIFNLAGALTSGQRFSVKHAAGSLTTNTITVNRNGTQLLEQPSPNNASAPAASAVIGGVGAGGSVSNGSSVKWQNVGITSGGNAVLSIVSAP